MATRRRAREIVLQLLYEADLNPHRDAAASRAFIRSRMQGRKGLTAFADNLLRGTYEHREQIDAEISKLATHWSLSRMAVTDRTVLRLGGYEIMFGDTLVCVALNEVVVSSKRYGDGTSPRFVNGVHIRLMREHEGERRSS